MSRDAISRQAPPEPKGTKPVPTPAPEYLKPLDRTKYEAYCAGCWKLISRHERVCPNCGYELPDPTIDWFAKECRKVAEEHGFEANKEIIFEKICLIMSELGEAVEWIRDGHWEEVPEELADVIIRTFHLMEGCGWDSRWELMAKLGKNRGRPYKHGREL